MSAARENILQALRGIRLIDPHSHINPHAPASKTLADLLGYHYYTELAHSAGMPKVEIESRLNQPRELVGQLVKGLGHITNTAQYAWLIDICQRFFGLQTDSLDESNWEAVYDAAEAKMQMADWCDSVLEQSNVESVFLTNDFDDALEGFDTNVYVPCLRTDDLVFHLSKPEVRDRLAISSGIDLDGSLHSLRSALAQRFDLFVSRGARACAISLPPDFSPQRVSDGRASTALEAILKNGLDADAAHKSAIARRVFWTIVELCDEYRLPMDLMIGVNRGVYVEGVHQGRDLYDSRVSLIQYRELFNTFPDVKFPISVLASVTNQELVSYAWIFPNVITNGHWWYSNTPSFIRRDAQARLEAVPRNKQIGYYSDAYKLEFIAPKFDMYRRILAGILFDDFVVERGWSEEQAIELGRQVLRGNVETIFPHPGNRSSDSPSLSSGESNVDSSAFYNTIVEPVAGTLGTANEESIGLGADIAGFGTAALAAGAAGLAFASDDQPQDELIDDTFSLPPTDGSIESADQWAPEAEEPLDIVDHEPLSDELQLDLSDDLQIAASEELDFKVDDLATAETTDFLEPDAAALFEESPADVLDEADLEVVGDELDSPGSDPLPLDLDDLSLDPLESAEPDDAPEIHYYRGDDEPVEPNSLSEADELQLDATVDDAGLPESQAENSDLDWFANPNTGELTLPVPSEAGQGGELDEQYLVPEAEESDEPNFDMYQTVYSPHVLEDHDAVESAPLPAPVTEDEPLALEELDLEPIDEDAVLDFELLDDEPELDQLELPEGDHQDFNPLATLEWTEPISEEKEPE